MNPLLPILLVAFLGIMFLANRRQKKEARTIAAMQDALSVGDRVMTTSGLHGTLTELAEGTVGLEIAPGIVTTWNRLAIRSLETADEVEDDQLEAVHGDDVGAVAAADPAAPTPRKD